MLQLDHGGVQPHGIPGGGLHAVAPVGALPDNGGGGHIPCLQGIHKGFAVGVDEHGAHAPHLLRHQRAENLGREGRAGGVILQRIRIQQPRARPVAQHQTVRRRAVVVGGGEALVVEPSRAAGGQDDRLGTGHLQLAGLHIHQHRARAPAVLVQNQLHGGGEVHHGNLPVQRLVPQCAHDLRAGVVLGRVHALAGGAAAVGSNHGAVGGLVELHAQLTEPADGLRGLGHQLLEEVLLSGKVAAAVGVQEVLGRGVVGLVGGLDAALRHHGVGVAHAQLGHHHHLRAGGMGLDGRGGSRAAAADDQYVYIVGRGSQVHVLLRNAGVGLQQRRQLVGDLVALVGAGLQDLELVLPVVGMVGLQQLVLLLRGHAAGVQLDVLLSGGGYLLGRRLDHWIMIHVDTLPYCSISRLLYISRISASDLFISSAMRDTYLPSSISFTRSSR